MKWGHPTDAPGAETTQRQAPEVKPWLGCLGCFGLLGLLALSALGLVVVVEQLWRSVR